jgi:hypothetical protein
MEKNICYVYKNDLKFNNINIENSEFDSEKVKEIYNNYKGKPKIELRIEDSKMENYKFLDLSKLDINDIYFEQIINLERIKKILERIEFLDLSNNKLKKFPDLSNYKNIKFINIAFNEVDGEIEFNNLDELTCHNNEIKRITSKKLKRLNASNNKLIEIELPNIEILIVNFNKLNYIPSYLNLKYLECIDNELVNIDNMINLEELYIGNNKLLRINNMPKLLLLNCINNPVEKIKYFPNLKMLLTSVPNISSQYNISNISKVKNDYLINFKV